ncbi:MAG: (4Fe-4S)-binding protein [Bacteroidales bacterium]|jgi:uncharacterized Fe-S cluster protein YjdI
MEREGYYTGSRRYNNDEITVFWKPSACIHASYCYRELLEVFDPGRRPWVDMKGASTDRIIETVNMCPTEALTWKWNDESKNQVVGSENSNHIRFKRPELLGKDIDPMGDNPMTVKVMIDGPIVLKGDFTLINYNSTREISDGLISICRCGKSDHQPFCDGQHRKTGFRG